MRISEALRDKYFLLLLFFAIVFVIYWVAYGMYRYDNFLTLYFDLGDYTSSMYQHLYCLNTLPGLQYLVVINHVSPLLLFFLPIFAIYPSPLALYLIQDVFLALTAITIYIVSVDVAGSKKISFAFAFAFLINPGVRALALDDVHVEAFIALFYILAFYFFWKGNRRYFALSFILLLCVEDIALPIDIALLMGLFFYEIRYNRKKGKASRLDMIAIGGVLTALFAVFYLGVSAYLASHYSMPPYSAVQPIQKDINFFMQQVKTLNNTNAQYVATGAIWIWAILGLILIFLGFGFTSLADIVFSLLLFSAWILEAFVVRDPLLSTFEGQYYGLVIGASFVAALVGLMIMKDRYAPILTRRYREKYENAVFLLILVTALVLSLATLPLVNVWSTLLFRGAPSFNYAQLNSVIAMIPHNASVMAQEGFTAHLFYICNLEIPPERLTNPVEPLNIPLWTRPDYIIIDSNLPYYSNFNTSSFSIRNYTRFNYTEIYNNSGVVLYKERS